MSAAASYLRTAAAIGVMLLAWTGLAHSQGPAQNVILVPSIGIPTAVAVTCGITSTAMLAANAAGTFVEVQNPTGSAGAIWYNVAGVAAVAAPPSLNLQVGFQQVWSAAQGFVPNGAAWTCIAAAPTTITMVYR